MILESHKDYIEVDEFIKIYPMLDQHSSLRDQAVCLLRLSNWYISLCEFDPLTHQIMPETLSQLLIKISNSYHSPCDLSSNKDRFTRIIEQCYQAVRSILVHPKERIIREHGLLPLNQVRIVDNTSLHWLSRQSGRNFREKLSGKNQMLAVQRRMSLDTAENRLLKKFLIHLEDILLIREDTNAISVFPTPEDHDELLQKIQLWLQDENVKEIKQWDNLPPNNVLLNDKNYRKIWDSWQQLKSLDEQVQYDWSNINTHMINMIWWSVFAHLKNTKNVFFIDMPCEFNYEKFEIKKIENIKAKIVFNNQPTQLHFSNVKDHFFDISIGQNHFKFEINLHHLNIYRDTQKIKSYHLDIESLDKICIEIFNLLIGNEQESVHLYEKRIETEVATLDINSLNSYIKPLGKKVEIINLRFLTQFWPSLPDSQQDFILNASYSNALSIEHTIISCRHLWQEKAHSLLSGAIDTYINELQKQLITQKLFYLVPDYLSDFSTEKLRFSLNFSYPDAIPLPRSIAAIINWQTSNSFAKADVKNGDLFFIADNCEDGVYITPVQAIYNEKLLELIPQTKGICWERHPSFQIEGMSDKGLLECALFNTENKHQSLFKDKLCEIFHFDELYRSTDNIALVSNDTWYFLEKDIKEKLRQIRNKQNINKNTIIDELKFFNVELENVKMMSISSSIRRPYWLNEQNWLPLTSYLVNAGETLHNWQSQAPNAIFWRDHLPKLSTRTIVDGQLKDFYFVNDAPPVQPKRGMTVHIPIEETFILPKGQSYFEFPLNIGKQTGKNGYLARLNSNVFPLTQDIECSLSLTYTYGANQPYELKFVPKDDHQLHMAKFSHLFVKWLPNNKKVKFVVPTYPKSYSWHEFENYNDGSRSESKDLYDWLARDLSKIRECCNFILTGNSKTRITIDISNIHWRSDRNDMSYGWVSHPEHGEIYIHEGNFEKFDKDLKVISVLLEADKNNKNNKRAKSITEAGCFPVNRTELSKIFSDSYRFPMLTMWNNGNALTDSNIQESFKNEIILTIASVVNVISDKSRINSIPKSIKGELRQFCCYLHTDMPEIMIHWLVNKSQKPEKIRSHSNKFAYALGDLSNDWQQTILTNLLKELNASPLIEAAIIEILSTAIWRNKSFIHQIRPNDIKKIIDSLLKLMKDDKLGISAQEGDWEYSKLMRRLELLLGLLRIQESQDQELKSIFIPDSKTTNTFIQILNNVQSNHGETLYNKLKDNKKVKSRVQFNDFKKPKSFMTTPDIIYALRLYLTGDDGANLISITGVVSN